MLKKVIINVKTKTMKTVKSNSKRNNSSMPAKKGNKTKTKTKSKSSLGGKSGNGKIFGVTIPIISDIIKSENGKKLLMGAGLVSIALTTAAVVNNQKVNETLNKKGVKPLIALAGGDFIGAGYQFAKDEGLFEKVMRRGGMNTSNGGMLANEADFA